jgi:hypothetical protein
MDAMHSAIKGRRGGMLNEHEENAHQMPKESQGEGDMQGLVESLSDEQKAQLMGLLQQDMSEKPADGPALEKGSAGPGEEQEVAQMAMEDQGDEHESEDEIMESMISSADKGRVEQDVKPRNLAERMKMNLASKLKGKGKH